MNLPYGQPGSGTNTGTNTGTCAGTTAGTSAVALTYQPGTGAPRVVAQGRGLLAEEIIRRAQESGLHVHRSSELVALLMQVDLDSEIPPTLYRVVAELLAWLYNIEAGITEPLPR